MFEDKNLIKNKTNECDHAIGIEDGYNGNRSSIILNSDFQKEQNRWCIDHSFIFCPKCGEKLIK